LPTISICIFGSRGGFVIGTGTGGLPVMDEVKQEAERRGIKLVILPTTEAIDLLKKEPADTNAILHVTC
jgi:hypothetical protein